jgi:hypothetical protein
MESGKFPGTLGMERTGVQLCSRQNPYTTTSKQTVPQRHLEMVLYQISPLADMAAPSAPEKQLSSSPPLLLPNQALVQKPFQAEAAEGQAIPDFPLGIRPRWGMQLSSKL